MTRRLLGIALLLPVFAGCGRKHNHGTGTPGTLTITPDPATLSVDAGGAPATQQFHAIEHTASGDVDVTAQAIWSIDDYTMGAFVGSTFTSVTSQGGTTLVHAHFSVPHSTTILLADATLQIAFHAVVTTTCPGCVAFPPDTAPACAGGAPSIAYPPDGVLLPPNMNVIESHFVPGAGEALFEVDFTNAVTDVRVETPCVPITDTRGFATGGCTYALDPAVWGYVAHTNRGGDPVVLTVKGAAADASCVSASPSRQVLFSQADLAGGIYYWQSIVIGTVAGKAGGIYRHDFGNPAQVSQAFLTPASGSNKCYGCHFLSRDGQRMTYGSDDADSDDEYGDLSTDLIAILGTSSMSLASGLAPGFQTFAPDDSRMLASDGKAGVTPPIFHQYSISGAALTSPSFPGFAGLRVTQPDWSWDGSYVYFVVPQAIITANARKDDDHFSGGSIWRMSYDKVAGTFGAPEEVVTSAGPDENDYYPSISPDGSFLLFDRALGTSMESHDAFNNAGARLTATYLAGGSPLDLAKANGGTGLTNSWPRWSPFITPYKGKQILWVTFSSTRDYGLRVRNEGVPAANGGPLVNCYPPEAPENPNGSNNDPLPADCNQPQIWMAAISLDDIASGVDGSYPAFWLPFQDSTAHNHIAQWVTSIGSPDFGKPKK
jgi:hypothetical protein